MHIVFTNYKCAHTLCQEITKVYVHFINNLQMYMNIVPTIYKLVCTLCQKISKSYLY